MLSKRLSPINEVREIRSTGLAVAPVQCPFLAVGLLAYSQVMHFGYTAVTHNSSWRTASPKPVLVETVCAAAAEATRIQYSGQDLIIIGSHDLTAEAAETGRRLHRPVRVWLLTNCRSVRAHLPVGGVTEIFELPFKTRSTAAE